MPRPLGSRKIPSYCRHKATDRAYATIGGRVVYFGPYGTPTSRARYDRAIAEYLAAGRTGSTASTLPRADPAGVTVSTVLAAFWTHGVTYYNPPPFAPKRRPAGELGQFFDVMKPMRRLYGTQPATSFGPLALITLRDEFVRMGWSRRNINKQICRARMIFKWAASRELVPVNVYAMLRTVDGLRAGRTTARETAPVRPVADEVIIGTREHLSRHVRAMVDLQLLTGMRPGELVGMRTRDIDMRGTVWIYRPAKHKTAHHGHAREIRIGPRAQLVLKPFLKTDLAAVIFSPIDAERERRAAVTAARVTPASCGNTVGTNRKRRPSRAPRDHYDVGSYRRAITRAADRADLFAKAGQAVGDDERIVPRWHPHQLRHNFATAIRRGYGPDAALTLLGDRTTRMVDIYAERDAGRAEKIIAAVG